MILQICVELLSRLHTTAPFFPVDTGEEDKGSRIAVAAAAAAAAASAAAEADVRLCCRRFSR